MSFWYLATPYSKFPGGMEAAYESAIHQSGILVKAGHVVYSPIVHCHPIFSGGYVNGGDHETWAEFDRVMITAAKGMIVCKLPSWSESRGIAHEIMLCSKLGKPIVYMEPGIVPDMP